MAEIWEELPGKEVKVQFGHTERLFCLRERTFWCCANGQHKRDNPSQHSVPTMHLAFVNFLICALYFWFTLSLAFSSWSLQLSSVLQSNLLASDFSRLSFAGNDQISIMTKFLTTWLQAMFADPPQVNACCWCITPVHR